MIIIKTPSSDDPCGLAGLLGLAHNKNSLADKRPSIPSFCPAALWKFGNLLWVQQRPVKMFTHSFLKAMQNYKQDMQLGLNLTKPHKMVWNFFLVNWVSRALVHSQQKNSHLYTQMQNIIAQRLLAISDVGKVKGHTKLFFGCSTNLLQGSLMQSRSVVQQQQTWKRMKTMLCSTWRPDVRRWAEWRHKDHRFKLVNAFTAHN